MEIEISEKLFHRFSRNHFKKMLEHNLQEMGSRIKKRFKY